MKNYPKLPVLKAMLVAGVVAVPALAFAQPDGTPGNPAGTAVGRALDRATGTETRPDGTPGNPPGTAVGRAMDRATGAPTHPDGVGNNPPGTALDRAGERAGQAVGQAVGPTMGPAAGTAAATLAAPGSAVAGQPRASKLIGANVYNENNESIGEVSDILLTYRTGGPAAVLSVGGFLGIGDRLVTVPLADLKWNSERERVVLGGATKDSLKSRPEFRYDQLSRG